MSRERKCPSCRRLYPNALVSLILTPLLVFPEAYVLFRLDVALWLRVWIGVVLCLALLGLGNTLSYERPSERNAR